MPVNIQFEIRNMVKEAILEYLLKRYIAGLTECVGGMPSIEPSPEGRPTVRIIAIKKGL